MAELEALFTPGTKPTPFSGYVNDLSPTEAKVIHDYFARIRTAMLEHLRESEIPLDSQCANPAIRVGQRALLLRPFRRSITRRHNLAEGEVRSQWPTNCEHDALGLDGAPVVSARPETTLAKRCADRLQRRNGPVRRGIVAIPQEPAQANGSIASIVPVAIAVAVALVIAIAIVAIAIAVAVAVTIPLATVVALVASP